MAGIEMDMSQEKVLLHEVIAKRFFYILFMIYTASIVLFHKEHNDYISTLLGLVLVASFLFYQLVYTSKTFYINSMLLIYIIFYLYSVLALTWTIDVDYSIYTVGRMAQMAVYFLLIYNILKIFKIHEAIFAGFMLGMLWNGVLAFELIDVVDPTYLKVRFIGTTEHPNAIGLLALYAILGSILWIQNLKNKWLISLNILNILASFYVILLTASRTSLIIGAFVILFFMLQVFLNKGARIYLIIFFILGFVGFIYFVDLALLMEKIDFVIERIVGMFGDETHEDSSTAERVHFLHTMMGVFKENPIFGTGVNTSRVFLNGFYTHNNYVEIMGTLGLVGLGIYYSAYVHLMWKIYNVRDLWLRYYFSLFMFVILVYDFASVTFYSKSILLFMLLLHFMAEENRKTIK